MTDNPANNPAEVAGPACPHCGTAIGEHEANACLNVWVATSLFGWVDTWVAHERSGGVPKVYANLPERQRDYVAIECPPYSTSISAAWEVVKHILKQPMNRGVDIENAVTQGGAWGCHIYTKADGIICPSKVVLAPTAPLAICRAAILATQEEKT